MAKIKVCVIAVYLPDGAHVGRVPISDQLAAQYHVVPLRLAVDHGETIYVDRVTAIRREASTKAGGLGERYTCVVTQEERQWELQLYKDGDEWYLEEAI